MPSPTRILLLLALAYQAMFGTTHLMIEVCHGGMQLRANDGSSCCATSHGDDERDEPSGEVLDGECSECFDIELSTPDELIATSAAFELDSPRVAVATIVGFAYVWPVADCSSFAVTRAPPHGVTPTGLLPGAFPLRI